MNWCALIATRRGIGKDRGAVAIFTALALFFVIPGFAALAVDIGRYMSERQQLQNALDAGALAGAQFLPRNEGLKAESAAREFALKNDPDLQGVPIDVSFGCLVGADEQAPTMAERTQVAALCNQYQNSNPNEPPLEFTCPGNGRCYRPCEFNNGDDDDDGCNAIIVSAKIAVPLILARAIPGEALTRMEANLTSQACRGSQGSCGPPQDLDLFILLDRSSTMAIDGAFDDKVAPGAISILQSNLNPYFHQVGLAVTPVCAPLEFAQGCNTEKFIKQDLTTDYESLIQLIEGLEVGGSSTDIATPIQQATDALEKAIPRHLDREVKKYIILLTDGAPSVIDTTHECDEAVAEARNAKENDIEIFTIGYFPDGVPSVCQNPDFEGKDSAVLLQAMAAQDRAPFQFSECTAANHDGDNFYCEIFGKDLQTVFNKILAAIYDLGGSSLVDLSTYRSE